MSVVIGIAFGIVPALKSTKIDLVDTLRDEGRTLVTARRWWTAKNALVTVQVTISVLLVSCAVLLFQGLSNTAQQNMGFAVEGVAILETDALYAGYEETGARAVYEELLSRITDIPGVESATLAAGAPVADFLGYLPLVLDGHEAASGQESVPVQWMLAGPGYFETLQIPLLYGRAFGEFDVEASPTVAVVNEAMARRHFGTSNAVGRRFRYDGIQISVEIVGVVADTLQELITNEPIEPRFYRTFTQTDVPATTVMARGSLDEPALVDAMQQELRAIDPTLPVIRAQTMADHLDDALSGIRILLGFLGGLALLGVSLAGLGLYAVVSYAVTSRFHEIGIRMALGARGTQVVRPITREVTGLVCLGVGLGIALSVAGVSAWGLLAAGLSQSDSVDIVQPSLNHPGTFALVALIMAAVGLLAASIPAGRAVRIDPLQAIRRH